jgi:hypothetical protein
MSRLKVRSLRTTFQANFGAALIFAMLLAADDGFHFGGIAVAKDLPSVEPTMSCDALGKKDFAKLAGAGARIDNAKEVAGGRGAIYCAVTGYIAPSVRFEVRLPTRDWTQRFLMVGGSGPQSVRQASGDRREARR